MKNKALYIICALLMVILGLSDALRGIFTPLFTDIFGFSMAQVGIIVSASYLGNLVCLLFGGVILDKIGRKKAMALFVLALAISELILLGGRVYFLLVLGFFLTLGISTLLNTTMNLLSDSFSATKSLMLLNALFFLQGIGTSGSQFILSRFSSSVMVWNGVLIAMAVLLIPLCIAITRIHTEGKAEVKKNEEASPENNVKKLQFFPIAMITISLGFYLIAEHGLTNYLIKYGTDYLKLTAAAAGLGLSLYSAGIMVGRLVLGQFVDRIGAKRMMLILLVAAFAVTAVVFTTGILQILFLTGLSVSLVYPTTVAMVRKYAPASLGARATTVAVSAASILDVIFNAVFGKAIDTFGYGSSMPVLLAALAIAAVLMALCDIKKKA